MKKRLIFLVSGFFFLISVCCSAQTDVFTTSLNLFKSGKYTDAQNYLENQISINANLPEQNFVLLAKIYNKILLFEKTIQLQNSAKIVNPNNHQEFLYEIGVAQFQLKDYNSALKSWILAYQIKPEAASSIKEQINLLVTVKIEWTTLLQSEMNTWLNQNIKNESLKNELNGLISNREMRNIKIGLLLPLGKGKQTPSEREIIGREILQGFLIGMDEFSMKSLIQTEIFVKDTEGDSTKAEKLGKELIESDKVNLIIGPVFSNECTLVSKLSETYKIPIISPTASDDALNRFSNYFFQLNPSLSVRGRQSAIKALEITKIEKDSVLVLAEDGSDTQVMANAFSVALIENGISVVDKAFYPYDSQDIRRNIPYSQVDTTQIKDIIYAPIEDESLINIVVPQLSYLKVFGFYVGNNNWDDKLKLRQYKRILDGMLICKDSHVDSNRVEVKNYKNDYRKRFHVNPSTISYRGFDSFLFVKTLVEEKVFQKPDLDVSIRNMKPVQGLQNTIDFRGQTVNQHLIFFRFLNNEIIPAENVEPIRPN